MNLNDYFPKTKFVKTFSFERQLEVVLEELAEVEDAYKNNTNTKEEIIDVMHSAMQLFYILETPTKEIENISHFVRYKNNKRKYYEN